MRLNYRSLVTDWQPERAIYAPLDMAFSYTVENIVSRAKSDAPVRTGRLKNSIRSERVARYMARVKADARDTGRSGSYAASQEFGSRPHEIKAKNKPMLQFWWERESVWFVGPRVRHPGTDPQEFISKNAEQAENWLILFARGLFR